MNNRIRTMITGVLILLFGLWGTWLVWKWGFTRVYVGPEQALVITSKFGRPLPPDQIAVPHGQEGVYKGLQEAVRGPGRYFINPVEYTTEIVDQVHIPAGEPQKWDWTPDGVLKDKSVAPMIGLVTSLQGKNPEAGQEVVDEGYKGIQREVLTPGTYKINPHVMRVDVIPAVVVPPGSVGVVTRLIGEQGVVTSARLSEIRAKTTAPTTAGSMPPPGDDSRRNVPSRLIVGANQRGILHDVLQPGIYYLNPRVYKVTVVPIGYDSIALEHPNSQIRFYSSDGYLVEADFTVVWGRSPMEAPNIVANIGDTDLVRKNVLEPAMKAACQNEGAKYTAKELIQGTTRSQFQDDLSHSLEKQVGSRNIHVLLALVRNITVKDSSGKDQTDGLIATIQRANIEVEVQLTNVQRTATEKKRAELQQALKLVDVARETVAADTKVKVANLMAEGQKKAAEIDAQREVDVAAIELQMAQLDAQRTQILGKAAADVEKLKREAEAKGAKMMVDALGSPQAYNQYIFAKNFEPRDLKLIFAGPGTFWTDLKSFQDVASSKLLDQASQSQQPQQK